MDLHGSCACGRNVFVVEVPAAEEEEGEQARIEFDNSSGDRRHIPTPFTAWLLLPLSWFHSSTHAFYPDETHHRIRRTFVSPFDPRVRRQFCGFCGTQLSRWTEEEESMIRVTLGCLEEESLERLVEGGALGFDGDGGSEEEEEEDDDDGGMVVVRERSRQRRLGPVRGTRHRGVEWYETLVRDTPIGRVKRRKGGHTSRDGRTEVEWEIVEIVDLGDGREEERALGEDVQSTGKRKIDEVDDAEENDMVA